MFDDLAEDTFVENDSAVEEKEISFKELLGDYRPKIDPPAPIVKPWVKACPFCGAPASIDDGGDEEEDEHFICCSNDDCIFQPVATGEDLQELIGKWNTRKG